MPQSSNLVSPAHRARFIKLVLTTAVMLSFGAPLSAQAPSASSPDLAGIAHAAFRTTNLSTSLSFYEKLGFDRAFELTKNAQPTEEFIKINDEQFIELYPGASPTQPVGLMHVCYEVNDLEALHQAYVNAGLDIPPVKKAGAGNLLFAFHGPGGEVIEFTQYMPGSMHSNDRGQHLGQNRVADKLWGVVMPVQDVSAWQHLFMDKLKFAPASGLRSRTLMLPGSSRETIAFVPSTGQSAARLLFSSTHSISNTERELTGRGIPFQRQGKQLILKDPDGNVLVLAQR